MLKQVKFSCLNIYTEYIYIAANTGAGGQQLYSLLNLQVQLHIKLYSGYINLYFFHYLPVHGVFDTVHFFLLLLYHSLLSCIYTVVLPFLSQITVISVIRCSFPETYWCLPSIRTVNMSLWVTLISSCVMEKSIGNIYFSSSERSDSNRMFMLC